MSDIAIRVDGISKLYQLGATEHYRTLRDTLTDTFMAPFRRLRRGAGAREAAQTLWALKNVSFEVKHGEVIGIIGRNGAGKSTLLKILSRITEPTHGRAAIQGRVGSLLEVGTGFHPELSGRENIFLNGAILGMKRAEILRKFDAIVAFAEVEKFIDTPVKHYSSGMYVRLAFAVAAHMETEVLIVDEVLSVGDASFQRKCLGKMGQVARQGRTVLFVSHNLTAVRNLCSATVWLVDGVVNRIGSPDRLIKEYLALSAPSSSFVKRSFVADDDVSILEASIEQRGCLGGAFITSEPLNIRIKYQVHKPVVGLRIGFDIASDDGIAIWRSFADDMNLQADAVQEAGVYLTQCQIPENLLGPSTYVISLSVGIHNSRWITLGDVQQTISVHNTEGVGHRYSDTDFRPGLLLPALRWRTSSEEVPA